MRGIGQEWAGRPLTIGSVKIWVVGVNAEMLKFRLCTIF